MKKKIFDILPSKKVTPGKKESSKEKKRRKGWQKLLWGMGTVLILAFVFCLILTLQAKLTLHLFPRQQPFSVEEYVKINAKISQASEIDFENKLLRGELFEKEKDLWQEFSSTGQAVKEAKAHGVIKIFNATNPPRAITLRKQTRFLSAQDSKLFRIPKKVYLPKPKLKRGKVVPTVTTAEVFAAEPGDDYNIGPSKFSVPGLAGTAYYFTIWAESEKEMTGGFKQTTKKVSQDDIKNAQEALEKELFAQVKTLLKNSIKKDYFLIDETVFPKEKETFCLAEPEQTIDKFNCQGKMKIAGLAVKKALLQKMSDKLIKGRLPALQVMNEKSLFFEQFFESYNMNNNEALIKLKVSAQTYQELDKNLIKQAIAGKPEKEIGAIITELFPEINKIKMDFWPFWVKRAPKNLPRIEIRVNL